MKKILAIGLMLCIFTAMAVGTAAAKSTASVSANQNVNAVGFCTKTTGTQATGASICTEQNFLCCKTVASGYTCQNACASAGVGCSSISQCAAVNLCVN
jgi:hypothetical protein